VRLKRAILLGATVAGVAITLALGFWQWSRAQQKIALEEAYNDLGRLPPVQEQQLLAATDPKALIHRLAVLDGEWSAKHTVYLDNRQIDGHPGFFVMTPLCLEGRRTCILVQRGWAPRNFQDRARLPPVETPAGGVTLTARLAPPPARLYEFDGPAGGPIRQNLDLAAFRAETGLPLMGVTAVQLGGASEGLMRNWPKHAGNYHKNYAYAFQWWALAGLIAFLYVWFQFIRRPRA
jgi:surfeit locus 1 family protein